MTVVVSHDTERDAWAVVIDNTPAITFEGDDAQDRAEATAARFQTVVASALPWLMSGDSAPSDDDGES